MALGASPGQIGQMIIGEAMKLTLTGLLLGVLGALLLTRLLVTILYNVNPTNAQNFLSVSVLLMAVPLISCLVPALRAMSIAPAISLRYE